MYSASCLLWFETKYKDKIIVPNAFIESYHHIIDPIKHVIQNSFNVSLCMCVSNTLFWSNSRDSLKLSLAILSFEEQMITNLESHQRSMIVTFILILAYWFCTYRTNNIISMGFCQNKSGDWFYLIWWKSPLKSSIMKDKTIDILKPTYHGILMYKQWIFMVNISPMSSLTLFEFCPKI